MINAGILAGTCVAAFVVGCLLTAAAAWMFDRRQMSSAPLLDPPGPAVAAAAANVRTPQINPWWRPPPKGFDRREHRMIVKLDRDNVLTRAQMLRTLIQNLASIAKWREPLPADGSSAISAGRDKFAGLIYLLSYLVFYNIALAKKERGPPSWNLLSPHLANLFHEIERSRKGAESEQEYWNLWTLEKCRIYACESLYPGIFLTEVINEEKQPTTNAEALSKMVSFIEDLLEPYAFIDDVFRNAFRRVLTIAGRLGVCIYKNMQLWCWGFAAPANQILLYPALCKGGNEAGIRYAVPKVILTAHFDNKCDIHGNLLE
ncbi:hypothetical protein G7Y89_g5742 [Cudoniella acicularis]|uniref:Uncharacterized protein n=1 Tax=Cudoniella acicularis TaxID=354080 RepID=A0A8H4RMQ5_9HELO|nr:hypothetical protein G7Y89_g5742 [Cudoniella acicularis]